MNHYAATNPAYDVSPVNDPQLIITTPIENESSSHRHGTDLPPHSKGTPITGCGELGPFSTSSPRSAQTPATTTIGHISGVNDTAEAPKLASSVDQSSPAVPSLHAQDDGQESDFRGRLKSAGDGSLSGEVEQPLDSANQEEEKLPFKDLTCSAKVTHVLLVAAKPLSILMLLYFFICSLNLLSSGFILIGGRMAGDAFGNNALLSNPVCGLMIGVVSTAFLQSSSTSTSIVVTMVASNILSVQLAIPIVMGSNIGTSVTGIFVAVTQAGDRSSFEKAFSAATVHDMFNWLTVITLLPLEAVSGYLYHLTSVIVSSVEVSSGGSKQQFLSFLTDPFTNLIVQVDKDALQKIAAGEPGSEELSLLKYWCETHSVPANTTKDIILNRPLDLHETKSVSPTSIVGVTPCRYIFHGTSLSEPAVGMLVLIIALAMLITCLVLMVKVLKSLLQSSMAKAIQKTIGADFPGKAACLTGYVALLVGAFVTVLVQSSSVVASALTPLVGLGVVTVERVYPMMLGANIGTTSTAILAAFASSSDRFRASFQIAMCHLFFNLTGILMWYPLPFMRAIPIRLAKFLGRTTAKYRWFAGLYILSMFFLIPLLIFALSIPGWQVLVGVGAPLILLLIIVGIVNLLQKHKPHWLPEKLRTWEFLPECLRSLAPMDRKITQMVECCSRCRCCKCCKICATSEIPPVDDADGSTTNFSSVYGKCSTDHLVPKPSPKSAERNPTINSSISVPSEDYQTSLPGRYESAV